MTQPSTPPHPVRLPPTMHVIERDWLSCNQILLFDEDGGAPAGATLVDSGYVKHAETTLALVRHVLSQRGFAQAGLRLLINTHLHSDHCGGNALLAQAFGCPILVPAAEFEAVARWDEEALSYTGTSQRCARFSAAGSLRPGDELTLGGARWQVHAAPGHDPHSLILHCPQHRVLISADALWENGFGVIFPELEGESGFEEQAAVLDLIATLDVDTVIPGHGRAFGDVPAAIGRARQRLDAMRADPARNARNAVRVLIKFLLLDRERMAFETLAHEMRNAAVMKNAGALIGMDLPQALAWGVDELERQGQLRREGDLLINQDP